MPCKLHNKIAPRVLILALCVFGGVARACPEAWAGETDAVFRDGAFLKFSLLAIERLFPAEAPLETPAPVKIATDWGKTLFSEGFFNLRGANWSFGGRVHPGPSPASPAEPSRLKTNDPVRDAPPDNLGARLEARGTYLKERLQFFAGLSVGNLPLANDLDRGPLTDVRASELKKLHEISPSWGVSYQFWDWLKIHFNYTQSYKTPERRQRDTGSPDADGSRGHVLTDSSLKLESAAGWEFKVGAEKENLSVESVLFQTDFQDKISSTTCGALTSKGLFRDLTCYRNDFGSTRYQGLKLSLSWNVGAALATGWDIRPHLALVNLFRVQSDSPLAERARDLNLNFGLSVAQEDLGLKASVEVSQFGRQLAPGTLRDSVSVLPAGNYAVVDAHLSKTIAVKDNSGRLTANLDIYNLGEAYYGRDNQFSQKERNVLLSMRYDF
ncbi:MAG: TonB-dependent receptor [Deltaproteobacteria bacterium]|jgi:outer membrane receptor protein involved in Fe transport|nr:TonB-dependent receptor [Deltaproteobacteria bacterium]